MIRISSATIRKEFVDVPVYICGVVENGHLRMAEFMAVGWVGRDRIRFERTS